MKKANSYKAVPKIYICLVILCMSVMLGGCSLALNFSDAREILNETWLVTDNAWRTCTFILDESVKLMLDLSVQEGGNFTAYLMNEEDYMMISEAGKSLFDGKFNHYESFAAINKNQHQIAGRLDAGRYVFAIKEASRPNILGGSDLSLVAIKITTK